MRRNTTLFILIAALVLILTPACALGNLMSRAQPATAIFHVYAQANLYANAARYADPGLVAPMNTPTATPVETATPVPTNTPEVPPTEVPTNTPETARAVINNPTVNLRSGPGTNYCERRPGAQRRALRHHRQKRRRKLVSDQLQRPDSLGDVAICRRRRRPEFRAGGRQHSSRARSSPQRAPVRSQRQLHRPLRSQLRRQLRRNPQYSFTYTGSARSARRNAARPSSSGQVQYANGSPQNGVCVLIDYYGPRTIKFSGSGGSRRWQLGLFALWRRRMPGSDQNLSSSSSRARAKRSQPSTWHLEGAGDFTPQSNNLSANITDKCTQGQWTNIIFKGSQ